MVDTRGIRRVELVNVPPWPSCRKAPVRGQGASLPGGGIFYTMWVRFNTSTYKSEVIPRAELDKAEAVFQAGKVGRAMEELELTGAVSCVFERKTTN